MTQPIRIMQVLEATAGGTRRHLREVVDALSTPEFALHIVCALRRDPDFQRDIERFRSAGHRVSLLPMTRAPHPLHDARSAWGLARLMRREPVDVVHLHSAKAGALGRLVGRGTPTRIIYTPHGFPFLQRTAEVLRQSYETAERWNVRRTDLLLAVSRAEARLARDKGWFAPDRVEALPNALDLSAFDASLGALRPVPDAPRTFGLIGDLRPQKNPFAFLEAIRRLHAESLPFRALLPRHGPALPAALRFVRRHRMESIVSFVPADGSLTELLRRTDVAVLPSLWEGLPYSALEALAAKRPLVTSDLPVFRDLVGPVDAESVVSVDDVANLVDVLRRWARAPSDAFEAFGRRGRQRVAKHHDAADWRERLRAIYRVVASRDGANW